MVSLSDFRISDIAKGTVGMKGQFKHCSVSEIWLNCRSIKTADLDRVQKGGVVDRPFSK